MSLKQLREFYGFSYEELSSITGLDVETIIQCEKSTKDNSWALELILSVLEPNYEDVSL